MKLLPDPAGCFDADAAIRTARLGREAGMSELVKLEVLGDPDTLLPNPVGTLEAAAVLVKEGFTVLCYTSDDPVLARRLEDLGCAAVMPAGAPIGSGLGVLNKNSLSIIIERARVPILVDAGVGTASDLSVPLELGAARWLLHTAIALAKEPVLMASAMRHACEAGRLAWLAGRMGTRRYASASSPMQGRIGIAGE